MRRYDRHLYRRGKAPSRLRISTRPPTVSRSAGRCVGLLSWFVLTAISGLVSGSTSLRMKMTSICPPLTKTTLEAKQPERMQPLHDGVAGVSSDN